MEAEVQEDLLYVRSAAEPAINSYPYAGTEAQTLLANAIRVWSERTGESVRSIGKRLGYKQATVLSHMSNGRVGIPVDRAEELAEVLRIPKGEFLSAVLRQRYSSVDWDAYNAPATEQPHSFMVDMSGMAEVDAEDVAWLIREAAAVRNPRERWLTAHELEAVRAIRKLRPSFSREGLSASDLTALQSALRRSNKRD